MRFSEGTPQGRYAEITYSEMFNDHEEVIVFTRDEFSRVYMSIMERLDTITLIDLHLDRNENWKMIGYWPKIIQNVHRIDRNIDQLLKKEPAQSYLDAYLYTTTPQKELISEEESIPFRIGRGVKELK